MADSGALARGRQAFARRAWQQAHRELSASNDESPLESDDLERLAAAAYLTGNDDDAIARWKRLNQSLTDAGELARAARWGFWLSLSSLLTGDGAQSAGWLARTQRLLKDHPGCCEQGLLHVVAGLFEMGKGDASSALDCFDRAGAVAERFADPDLTAFMLLSRGQALILQRRASEGVLLLDEAMVTVTSAEVSPMAAGIVYCAVILTSQKIFDLQRAAQWTQALSDWCDSQPDMVPFRGACLVHRSQILQLRGEWPDAMEEAERSCSWFSERAGRASGRAFYQLAELHRLCGELTAAEDRYRDAGRSGMEPQPGLSLLRLAQGDLDAATAAIRRVFDEVADSGGPGGGSGRSTILGPYVEIMLAAQDLEAARAGAEQLAAIAAELGAPVLEAQSAHATGAVALAEGDAKAALAALRRAWGAWQQLEAPYEAARVRVRIARACKQLGDQDTANSHLDAARAVFERLGASPALSELDGPAQPVAPETVTQLSARELEVLALVAAGKTNRQIAAALFISEHTVARHMSNIFNKLDVTSRTAAAAFAFEHDLV